MRAARRDATRTQPIPALRVVGAGGRGLVAARGSGSRGAPGRTRPAGGPRCCRERPAAGPGRPRGILCGASRPIDCRPCSTYRDPPWPSATSRFPRVAASSSRGFGPFVTREVFRLPDGTRLLWDSRWHRKHAGRVPGGSTWWAPSALAWWMGVLFAVGSICFALGSFPPYATAVGTTPDNITFFVGSIFFTDGLLPAVHGGGVHADRARRAAPQRASVAVAHPAPPHRLVGRRHPVARHRCGSTGPP